MQWKICNNEHFI